MAVSKKNTKTPKGGNLIAATVSNVEDLMRTHIDSIMDFIADSEDKKETVNFGVQIDCSETEPKVTVGIRFSKSVTDSRSAVLDGTDQGTFEPVVEAAEQETEKRREKNMAKAGIKKRGKAKTGDVIPAAGVEAAPETT